MYSDTRRRNSPSPPDQHLDDPTMATQPGGGGGHRGFRQSSSGQSSLSSADEGQTPLNYNNPYSYGGSSQPSLPRYSSGQSTASSSNPSTNYLPGPSPLNPTATRGGTGKDFMSGNGNGGSRYSSYGYSNPHNGNGGGAHPLSNAMYLDSSPTLAGSDAQSPSEEKMRLGPSLPRGGPPGGGGGDYASPTTAPLPGATGLQRNTSAYRRGPKPTGLAAAYRWWSGASLADSGKDERHIKLPRLGYLDGLKFIAAWIVLNGTLFDAVLTSNDYAFIQRNSPLYITRSTGLGITFLLLLSGRSLVTPLWDVPSPTSSNAAPGSKPNTALISWARLTRAMLVRPFRFILPIIAVVALQWGLAATGKTSDCNAVGMDEPYWGLVSNFAGFSTLVFDLFTYYEEDTLAGKTFAANLFTAPWFFQASYAVYTTHFMLGNLSSNRYWVYAILATFSWATYNYFFVAILGLVIADMHAHGHLHYIRTKWPAYQRLALHLALIALALVTQWVPVVRDNINSGLAVLNVQDHPELTFCDSIFAFCWLFCIETSGFAQNVLGNVVMRNLGRISAGVYLLAPSIVFTIVPSIALSLHNNGSSASSVLGVSWLVLFIITLALAVAFHFVVEMPSKMLGEIFAELLEGADGSNRRIRKGVDGTKLMRRNPGGAAKLQQQQPPKSKPVLV